MATTLAERKMKIPFDTLMDIEAVASKCKTKFTNWEEFVDESLGLFVAWWDDPEMGEKMFHSMSPHFTKEMQDWLISQLSEPMDPKQFETKEQYLQTKAQMENELKTYKKKIEEVKEKTSLTDLKFNRYSGDDEPIYTITDSRLDKIKKIIGDNPNQFSTPKGFFDEGITYFIFFWTDQQKALTKAYDMWDNMASKTKEYMKKKYPGNFQRMEMGVVEYKKQASTSNDKGIEPETEVVDDVSSDEDEVKLVKPEIIVSGGPNVQRREIHDSGVKTFESLAEGYDETYTEIMDLKERGTWNKDEEGVLPYDNYPLIWSFYSRFMPVKLVVSVLADMVSDVDGAMVDYEKFRKRAYKAAVGLREHIRAWEKDEEIKRNEKRSTGLPISPFEVDLEKQLKVKNSETRFMEHFVGMSTKTWIRRQHPKEEHESKRKLKDEHDVAFFDGALNAMGLACFKSNESKCLTCDGSGTDKHGKACSRCYGGGKNYEIKVGLTKLGAQFYTQKSSVLEYPKDPSRHILTDGEIEFIVDHIIPRFSLEQKFIEHIISSLTEQRANEEKKYLDAFETDKKFEVAMLNWIQDQDKLEKKGKESDPWIAAFKNLRSDATAVTPWRVATMGRLVELNLVKWNVEKRTGKSLFELQITMQEKAKDLVLQAEQKLETEFEHLKEKFPKKEIQSLKKKVMKKLEAS